jgi:hypothetical protein
MCPASRASIVDVDNLYVKTAVANDGPRMKRIRPAPMGRAFRYQRRLTHIILSVAERGASWSPRRSLQRRNHEVDKEEPQEGGSQGRRAESWKNGNQEVGR